MINKNDLLEYIIIQGWDVDKIMSLPTSFVIDLIQKNEIYKKTMLTLVAKVLRIAVWGDNEEFRDMIDTLEKSNEDETNG